MIFWTALRKEIIEQWRTYRMLAVVVVLGVFGMTSPLLAKLTPNLLTMLPGGEEFASLIPPPTLTDAITQYVKNISQFSMLVAIFVAMGVIAQEKDKGTAVMILVKPLGRGTFLLAKFLALAFTFVISVLLAAIAGYYYTVFLFSAPDLSAWVIMNVLLCLNALVYVGITLLASTILRSQAAAAAMGFAALLLLSALGAIPNLGQYLPGQLVGWAAALFVAPHVTYYGALWVSLGVVAMSLLIGWRVLERQEL